MIKIHTIKFGFVKVYLLETESGLVLIDTGLPKSEIKLYKYMEKQKLKPKDIKLIIITHAHGDHVGSLKTIKNKTKAQILIHEHDGFLLNAGISPKVYPTIWLLKKFYNPDKETKITPVKSDIIITDEYPLEEFGINGKIIHTPGHTKGSITVIVESKNAFVGDIAMKIPPLSFSYEPIIAENLEQVYSSWQKIIDCGVETIYPSHGRTFNIKLLEKILNKRKGKEK